MGKFTDRATVAANIANDRFALMDALEAACDQKQIDQIEALLIPDPAALKIQQLLRIRDLAIEAKATTAEFGAKDDLTAAGYVELVVKTPVGEVVL